MQNLILYGKIILFFVWLYLSIIFIASFGSGLLDFILWEKIKFDLRFDWPPERHDNPYKTLARICIVMFFVYSIYFWGDKLISLF